MPCHGPTAIIMSDEVGCFIFSHVFRWASLLLAVVYVVVGRWQREQSAEDGHLRLGEDSVAATAFQMHGPAHRGRSTVYV
jgi:hypothetical protein